jgi:hypothetical protein
MAPYVYRDLEPLRRNADLTIGQTGFNVTGFREVAARLPGLMQHSGKTYHQQ